LENPRGKDHFVDKGIGRRVILKQIIWKWGWRVQTGFIWLRIVTSGGHL
jgi:hypothetical protein